MYWPNLKPASISLYTRRSCQYFQKEDLPLVITFFDVAKNNCEGFVGNYLVKKEQQEKQSIRQLLMLYQSLGCPCVSAAVNPKIVLVI